MNKTIITRVSHILEVLMNFTLIIDKEKRCRVWKYNDKEVHRKDYKNTSFDLQDCQLCWIYLTKTQLNVNNRVLIKDVPHKERSSRCNYLAALDDDRKIYLYFSELDKDIVRNILSTRLPKDFYLSKHIFDRDWAQTRVAYSYKDIFKFFEYADFKIKLHLSTTLSESPNNSMHLSSGDKSAILSGSPDKVDSTIIWGANLRYKVTNGLPDYTIVHSFFGLLDLGLHFQELNKVFFREYQGNEEFVKCLSYGLDRL
jgi:hypothetical protein